MVDSAVGDYGLMTELLVRITAPEFERCPLFIILHRISRATASYRHFARVLQVVLQVSHVTLDRCVLPRSLRRALVPQTPLPDPLAPRLPPPLLRV
jgi:hypothetical protein